MTTLQGLLEEAAQVATRIIEADDHGEGDVMDMEPLVVDARRVRCPKPTYTSSCFHTVSRNC
jgi:hypothetical protein